MKKKHRSNNEHGLKSVVWNLLRRDKWLSSVFVFVERITLDHLMET